MRRTVERLQKAIEITFFALFIVTPLAMHPRTHELFEFNKMWLVFIFSLIIVFLWGTKMIVLKRFQVRRTPFDIPILLFLLSQIISTIFSMDPHTSWWGYYTRFNGGLLSFLSYIFLYYAFATNVLTSDKEETIKKVTRYIVATLISGLIVALWGLPSHFGYDPTCLIFQGELSVACWTEAFQPKIRMFSTLGQPNWLAAFLVILIPFAIAFAITHLSKAKKFAINEASLLGVFYVALAALFYTEIGWTLSQSGFIGFWIGNALFTLLYLALLLRKNDLSVPKTMKQRGFQVAIGINVLFIVITFFTVNPIPRLQGFSFSGVMQQFNNQNAQPTQATSPTAETSAQPALEASITGSGEIRSIVWRGAIDIFKANPLFGTGVETYAFAYYKHRPIEHNLTSEWDYLYNKAHNEFLNYLATTGIFGLGTYLLLIFAFLFYAIRYLFKQFRKGVMGNILLPSFVGSFVGLHVVNFFGFSVVNVNLLMFFIPLWFYALVKNSKTNYVMFPQSADEDTVPSGSLAPGALMLITVLGVFCLYFIVFLINFWRADISYGLGYNYQRINDLAQANEHLEKAVKIRGGEDLYKNELSVNLASIAYALAQQNELSQAGIYATRAKELSDGVAQRNPNNVTYWKTRTRTLFTLAQLNPAVLPQSLEAIEHSQKLAPTDAKVLYNKALLLDQAGKKQEALNVIEDTLKLKINYRDAYYAKALFLSQLAEIETDPQKKQEYITQAVETLTFILKNIAPQDTQAQELLKTLQ